MICSFVFLIFSQIHCPRPPGLQPAPSVLLGFNRLSETQLSTLPGQTESTWHKFAFNSARSWVDKACSHELPSHTPQDKSVRVLPVSGRNIMGGVIFPCEGKLWNFGGMHKTYKTISCWAYWVLEVLVQGLENKGETTWAWSTCICFDGH